MDKQKIGSIIQKTLHEFPKMHGTLMIYKEDEVLFHEGFSYTDAPFPTNKNAQYLIASITKQFTAAALLKALYDKHIKQGISAADDQKLKVLIRKDLHQPFSTFLPSTHAIWDASMPGWGNQITLHHLLTHTSGIKNYTKVPGDKVIKESHELIALFKNEPLDFNPSEKYSYSNPGYFLLGFIIQEITKEPLDSYFKRVLFDPAQMSDSFLPLKGTPEDLKENSKFHKLLLGFEYNLLPDQEIISSVKKNVHFEYLSSIGGIVSTAQDCCKWNYALYHGKILPLFLVDLMTTPYIRKNPTILFDGVDVLWHGYGLDVYKAQDEIFYQHCGGLAGYQSRLSYNPRTKVSIVNLSNSNENREDHVRESERIKDSLLPTLSEKDRTEQINSRMKIKFPYYKQRIEERTKIFNFATRLRNVL